MIRRKKLMTMDNPSVPVVPGKRRPTAKHDGTAGKCGRSERFAPSANDAGVYYRVRRSAGFVK